MGAAEILKLIAALLPTAQNLVHVLAAQQAKASQPSRIETVLTQIAGITPAIADVIRGMDNKAINDALAIIGAVTPAAAQFVHTLDAIRQQTEEQYPEVWAEIRDDWIAAVAMWNGSHFAHPNPAIVTPQAPPAAQPIPPAMPADDNAN